MADRLLIVEDDPASRRLLAAVFKPEGYVVEEAFDGRAALARIEESPPALVLLDLWLPEIDGLEVLERVHRSHPDLPVIVMTARSDVKTAVRATRLGAVDYLAKPLDLDEMLVVVRRALEHRALRAEVLDLRRQLGGLAAAMGSSALITRVIDQVKTVAGSDFTVLVLGETGTGKELVAQSIHRQSDRHDQPFVALDCGAIPEALLESELFGHEKGAFTGADRRQEGRFRLASGGTLFLDEIGNLPLGLQGKLLRVLDSREVQAVGAARAAPLDVRFIAATNEDLRSRAETGAFRADLYFRLAQYSIQVPALRERPSDIPHLAHRFMDEVSVELRRPMLEISNDALLALQRYPWPGNVRELRNVIRQSVLECHELVLRGPLVTRFLGQPVLTTTRSATSGRSLREIAADAARDAERHAISEALRATRGNKSQAARALQTDFKTLHLKMKALGIRSRDFIA